MKAIHNNANWKFGFLKANRGETHNYLWYANAACTREGEMYPPIQALTILFALRAARILRPGRPSGMTTMAALWELCAKYEWGEYDHLPANDLAKIRACICEVHQHLGDQYNQFVIS